MKKRKIGIMGGTFNPIHNGHIALAQAAYDYCCLDEVWFMPSGVSYLKSNDKIASGSERFEMTCLAVEDIPYFCCSDIEISREGNTYTVDTLRFLKKMYPEDEFYFILGADSLFGLLKWREPRGIIGICTFVSVVRDDVNAQKLQEQKRLLEEEFDASVILVPFDKMDISSSAIRERLLQGKSVKELIPEKVFDYIKQHELYGEEWI